MSRMIKVFKRKKKSELSVDDQRLLERLDNIKEYVRELQSELNFGYIGEAEYVRLIDPIVKELAEMEKAKYKDLFDEQMGKPIQWLDEIFNTDKNFDDRVHNEIERVINECAKQTETD